MASILSLSTLPDVDANVEKPAYAREDLSPGIVHIGVGNFHRAHQAVYLDRLFNKGLDHDWALIGAGIKPYDAAMRERTTKHDLDMAEKATLCAFQVRATRFIFIAFTFLTF